MKQHIITLLIACLLTNLNAQKDVYLKINHLFGTDKFELNKSVKNNLGFDYNIKRIDYYISKITLHHDGINTAFPELYILIRNGGDLKELLGNVPLTKIDSVSFLIGVDEDKNHLDPSQYHTSHALAPKSPDMHWGWASGYKFVAVEGENGDNLALEYQVHALGDPLIKKVTLKTSGVVNSDHSLTIDINANFLKVFEDININKKVFIHGSSKEAPHVMENFAKNVFSVAEAPSSTVDNEVLPLRISENPLTSPELVVYVNQIDLNGQLIVRNATGKLLYQRHKVEVENTFTLENNGIYYIQLLQNNKLTYSSKVVVAH